MKRIVFIIALLISTWAQAQVYIDINQLQQYQNVRLRLRLADAKSEEPISYASVYLIPKGDTVITQFALTDEKGAVEIREIKPGKYTVNAEMIGYKPYAKEHELKGWDVNLGMIRLEEDPEYIDAATITAIGNPITIKKDTIEYNANAFRVGENAMLGELLKKMPGMEVDEDGSVKVNGEKVDKLTVGGKTFFFKDPSMAVKNLPAKIVNKIKVIDKDKPQAAFTGVSNGKEDKERVMDLELKEEYQKGWFGNAKLAGGMTLPPQDAHELVERRKFVFNGNGLLSGYNERDQVVFLGSGMNAADPGSSGIIFWNGGSSDAFDTKSGLTTSAQVGANYNTERIPDYNTSVSANYKHNFKDAREKSARTAFQDDGNHLLTDGRFNGTGSSDELSLNFEFENKEDSKAKVPFYVYPALSISRKDRNYTEGSVTTAGGTQLNQTESRTGSQSRTLTTGVNFWSGVRDLGKEKRRISFGGDFSYTGDRGDSQEFRETTGGGSLLEQRDLLYAVQGDALGFGGNISYTEPFGEYWNLQARVNGRFSRNENGKAASDRATGLANDYYSSSTFNKSVNWSERLLVQYNKDPLRVTGGLQIEQNSQETRSRSLGKDNYAPGEWRVNLAPYLNFRYTKDTFNAFAYMGGQTETPSNRELLATIDISDPMQIRAGNAWLRPSFTQYAAIGFNYSNPRSFSFLNLNIGYSLISNQTVNATWFDSAGIRYAIPVNAKTPAFGLQSYLNYSHPLDREKRLTFSIDGSFSFTQSTSYQPLTRMDGIITASSFDYQAMMAGFWGDASGDRFYSGASGFRESRTRSINWSASPRLSYRLDAFTANAGYSVFNNRSRYSLDATANTDVWHHTFTADVLYRSEKGLEISTGGNYTFYRGYSYGYGTPQFIWNAGISQTIKQFTISLKVSDLLGKGNNLRRQTTDEYVLDTYSNILGRYFLLGVSFNFGKMNAKNNRAVQDAMWRSL